MKRPGRPKTSHLDRAQQLRVAKRKQRERERAAGLVHVQLRLPRAVAAKLAVASRTTDFTEALDSLLDQMVLRLADFPALKNIAWNRSAEFIPAREAFGLYERNWRFVNPDSMDEHERAMVDSLVQRYGNGVIHA